MLMPIVSMNKMSMNESVAASCCWRYVLGVHEQYPEILHGGKIGTTYEVKLEQKGDYKGVTISKGWLSLPYDVSAGWVVEPIYYDPDNSLWRFAKDHTVVQKESVSVAKSSCPHNDGSCSYYNDVPTYSQDMHIGATSAHGTEKKWDEPHKAVQYSS